MRLEFSIPGVDHIIYRIHSRISRGQERVQNIVQNSLFLLFFKNDPFIISANLRTKIAVFEVLFFDPHKSRI
jgi:hypothetical protein